MSSSIVTDSMTAAWARVQALLFDRVDIGRWLKLGFIALLGAGAGGGGGLSYNVPSGGGQPGGGASGAPGPLQQMEIASRLRSALGWMAANIEALILLAVGLAFVWLVLMVAMAVIRAIFRFLFVEAVGVTPDLPIGATFSARTSHGLSLILWQMLIGIVSVILIGGVALWMVASIAALALGEESMTALGVVGLVAGLGMTLGAVAVAALVHALTEDFLVPTMHLADCGVWEAWRRIIGSWSGQLGNLVFFYLLKLVFTLIAALAGMILAIPALLMLVLPAASLGAVALSVHAAGIAWETAALYLGAPALLSVIVGTMALSYVVSCLYLPISVFFRAYSLGFLGRVDPALRTV